MPAISAAMVKELRERTGAGMSDCKNALVEAEGEMEKAVTVILKKGIVKAAARAGRVATEGEIAIAVHGGFFQVGPGEAEDETLATVLAGIAEKVSEIDVARAQTAKESAEAEIATDGRNEQETTASVMARAALERAELRLSAAKAS